MMSEDFSLIMATEDFFDVAHMMGNKKDRTESSLTVVSRYLNPNLKYFTPRVNRQVGEDQFIHILPHCG